MDIASGMHYLHDSRNTPHCDLKSPNVLVRADWHCVVADFNLTDGACQLPEGFQPRWAAPELLEDNVRAFPSKEADVFAFGVVMWELLELRTPPWGRREDADAIKRKVLNGERPAMGNAREGGIFVESLRWYLFIATVRITPFTKPLIAFAFLLQMAPMGGLH
jgi:serine/threonine protein kinase